MLNEAILSLLLLFLEDTSGSEDNDDENDDNNSNDRDNDAKFLSVRGIVR